MNEDSREKAENNDNKSDIESVTESSVPQKQTEHPIRRILSALVPPVPKYVEKPFLDQEFDNLQTFERTTEALTYNIRCLEYSISPKGALRWWLKLNLIWCIIIGIPVLLFVPLTIYIMRSFADVTESLIFITENILITTWNVYRILFVIILIFTTVYVISKLIFLKFKGSSKSSPGQSEPINVTPDSAEDVV